MSMSQVCGAPSWGLGASHLSKHGGSCSSSGSPFVDHHYDSMTSVKQVVKSADIFGGGTASKTAWNSGSNSSSLFGSAKDNNNNCSGKSDKNSSCFGGGPEPSVGGGSSGAVASTNPWGDIYKSRQSFNEMHFC